MGFLLVRVVVGWAVSWALWRLARPYGRLVGRGSVAGIAAGVAAGAVVGMMSVIPPDWETNPDSRSLTGLGALVGSLAGSAVGAWLWPAPVRKPGPVVIDPGGEPAVPDPRWNTAVEHLGRFRTVKGRLARETRRDAESGPGDAPGPP